MSIFKDFKDSRNMLNEGSDMQHEIHSKSHVVLRNSENYFRL